MSPVVSPLRVERDHVAGQAVEAAHMLRDRHRREGAVAVTGHRDLDLADLGRDRLRIGPVAGVPGPAPSRVVGFVAEMLGELDLQAGLQHLAHQVGEQAAVAGQLHTLLPRSNDQLFRPRTHVRRRRLDASRQPLDRHQRRRIARTTCSHGSDPPQSTTLSRGPSDHAGYTNFLTVPRAERSRAAVAPDGDVEVRVRLCSIQIIHVLCDDGCAWSCALATRLDKAAERGAVGEAAPEAVAVSEFAFNQELGEIVREAASSDSPGP